MSRTTPPDVAFLAVAESIESFIDQRKRHVRNLAPRVRELAQFYLQHEKRPLNRVESRMRFLYQSIPEAFSSPPPSEPTAPDIGYEERSALELAWNKPVFTVGHRQASRREVVSNWLALMGRRADARKFEKRLSRLLEELRFCELCCPKIALSIAKKAAQDRESEITETVEEFVERIHESRKALIQEAESTAVWMQMLIDAIARPKNDGKRMTRQSGRLPKEPNRGFCLFIDEHMKKLDSKETTMRELAAQYLPQVQDKTRGPEKILQNLEKAGSRYLSARRLKPGSRR